jgi:DNA replication protein DnaC
MAHWDPQFGFADELKVSFRGSTPLSEQKHLYQVLNDVIINRAVHQTWVYLWGPYGDGKTTRAAGAITDARADGQEAYFIEESLIIDLLRSAVKDQEEYRFDSIIGTLSECPLLAIDELGGDKITDWATGIIFKILNHRYVRNLPTILTSNREPSKLSDGRLASRCQDFNKVVVAFCGKQDVRKIVP